MFEEYNKNVNKTIVINHNYLRLKQKILSYDNFALFKLLNFKIVNLSNITLFFKGNNVYVEDLKITVSLIYRLKF